jgi:glucodextranase-like protein
LHRFGTYVRYKLPDNSLSPALLGKDNSHWSYLLDSQGSVMYGNGWQDNGDGTFTSIAKQNAFSQLDLYLLGMIPKDQVPPMLLINNPAIDATQLPFLGATVSGTATTVTINDIVAAEGERVPSSATSLKQFNIGFVLLTRSGDSIGNATQAMDTLRKGFAGRFAKLTQGIGSIANVPASLEVIIDTPANGAIITGPSVQVTGAVINTTGVETGVTVNGIPATVNGSQFVANNIQLQQGANTITVTATDINARTSTATKTVTAQLGNYIRLTTNTESGIAPLNSTITISGSFSITNSELYYSGPTDILLTGDYTVTDYPLQFPVEGNYILTANVTGPDGLVYEDSVTITVLPKLATDRLFRNKWNLLTGSLVINDSITALSTILTTAKPKYQERKEECQPHTFDKIGIKTLKAKFPTKR